MSLLLRAMFGARVSCITHLVAYISRIKMPMSVNVDTRYIYLFSRQERRRRNTMISLLAKVVYNEADDDVTPGSTRPRHRQNELQNQNNICDSDSPGDKAVQTKMVSVKLYNPNEIYKCIMHKLKIMDQPAQLRVYYSYEKNEIPRVVSGVLPTGAPVKWTKIYFPRRWEAGCRRHKVPYSRGLKPWIPPIPCVYCSTGCRSVGECQHGFVALCWEAKHRRMRAPIQPRRELPPLRHGAPVVNGNGGRVNGNPDPAGNGHGDDSDEDLPDWI